MVVRLNLLFVCYPSLGLRWTRTPMEMLSPRIHLPSPPPLCCYHDNTECSLQLQQAQGRSHPHKISLSLSAFSHSLDFSDCLFPSLARSQGRNKVGHKLPTTTPHPKKELTETLIPSAVGPNWCVVAQMSLYILSKS